MADWRSAVGKPPSHRISKDDQLNQSGDCGSLAKVTTCSIIVLFISFIAMLVFLPRENCDGSTTTDLSGVKIPPYNSTYPLTPPVRNGAVVEYRLAVITDLDHASKLDSEKNTWRSHMRRGVLRLNRDDYAKSKIVWDQETIDLKSTLAQGGRSMELSDLTVFDGHLISVDDRTGVLYRINGSQAVAWALLPDGDGRESKGFKGEWLAVKDGLLYVGGLGE